MVRSADSSTLQLRYWQKWPLWSDPNKCIAYLEPEENTPGMLRSPKISEAGRKLLADLLEQFTEQQIRDLFKAAKADELEQSADYASIDQWLEAFKKKRAQITQHHCPN